MPGELVIPSEIDWKILKGRDLEECIYWLLDALGAKDIDWRIGGTSGGAADGGRDLECTFHVPQPTGDIVKQTWWVEAKGRKGTVPSEEVRSSVHSVAGRSNVDVHLIVTNSQLSNPTKDWLKDWKAQKKGPDVRVWECQDLERFVCQNPVVALRLFRGSLTPEGRKEAFSTKFWDYLGYGDQAMLRILWSQRHDIDWDDRAYFAVVASEIVNGNLAVRPWGTIIPDGQLLRVYLSGLLGGLSFFLRSVEAGVENQPVIQALAHLFMQAVLRVPTESLAVATERFYDFGVDYPTLPDTARDLIVDPVFATVFHEVGIACRSDCHRIMTINDDDDSSSRKDHYWNRFRMPDPVDEVSEGKKPIQQMYLEIQNAKCSVGLRLNKRLSCPLSRIDDLGASWSERIDALRPIISRRLYQSE